MPKQATPSSVILDGPVKTIQPRTPIVGVRLPTPLREALQREAVAKEETLSELIRDVLTRHTKRQKRN